MATRKRLPKGVGQVRQHRSGRWGAKVRDSQGVLHSAPMTFDTRLDATAWLEARHREVLAGAFIPPDASEGAVRTVPTLAVYAEQWLATRELKPRTRVEYRGLLDRHILPTLGSERLDRITPAAVRTWNAKCCPDSPSTRAKAYGLFKTVMATAEDDGIIERNPARIKGAGTPPKRATEVVLLEPAQVVELTRAMPERLKATIVLGTWTALRLGEVLGLQRRDIDLDAATVTVRHSAVKLPGGPPVLGTPKSDAGSRRVGIPPHALPLIEYHLDAHTGPRPESLLFPATRSKRTPMSASTFYKSYYPARESIGEPGLKFHHLRHLGGTLSARAGATLAELMARLGHTTPTVAMRYQHAVQDREDQLAAALSGLASGTVVPLERDGRRDKPA